MWLTLRRHFAFFNKDGGGVTHEAKIPNISALYYTKTHLPQNTWVTPLKLERFCFLFFEYVFCFLWSLLIPLHGCTPCHEIRGGSTIKNKEAESMYGKCFVSVKTSVMYTVCINVCVCASAIVSFELMHLSVFKRSLANCFIVCYFINNIFYINITNSVTWLNIFY